MITVYDNEGTTVYLEDLAIETRYQVQVRRNGTDWETWGKSYVYRFVADARIVRKKVIREEGLNPLDVRVIEIRKSVVALD